MMPLTTKKFRIILGVSLAFIYIASIFTIIGLTTNYWLEIRNSNVYKDDVEIHFGLHRVCWTRSDRCNDPVGNYDKHNQLPTVQGLVITGSILTMIASIFALVNFYCEFLELHLSKISKVTSIATIVIAAFSGILLIIGCIIFSEKIEIDQGYGTMFDRYAWRGYSFGLTTCAGAMMWVGGILLSVTRFLGKMDLMEMKPPFIPGTPSSFGARSPAPSFIS